MLMPKRVKHRKQMRGSLRGKANSGNTVSYGEYGIVALEPCWIKPLGTRMGSGKGAVDHWVAVVKPGRVMFEIAGVPEETAREALRLASHKLPCKVKIMSKAETEAAVAAREGGEA